MTGTPQLILVSNVATVPSAHTRRHSAVSFSLLLYLISLGSISSRAQTPAATSATQRAFLQHLSEDAIERTHHHVRYDAAYVRIPYPGGDVPADTGVCTDVVIRSYRAMGIDLQKEVHEDIVRNLAVYPLHSYSSAARPDTNIDHRRVFP